MTPDADEEQGPLEEPRPPEPPPTATSRSLYLIDAPGDVDSVWVQIDDVLLVGEGGTVSLLEAPSGLLNLTSLRDTAAALAVDLEIDPGAYRQVRLVLGGAVLEAEGEQVYTMGGAEHPGGLPATGALQCPGCASSGIKIKLPRDLEVVVGENGLLLDFDVAQSFGRQAGRSGRWVMRPVIHATLADPDDAAAGDVGGEIKGTVVLGVDGNGDPLSVPACGGADRTLESFVPTAAALALTDDEGDPLVFAGSTEAVEGGHAFKIETAALDAFALGYSAETEFEGESLVWEATVEPAQVELTEEASEAEGVEYTVTSVTCEANTP